MHYYVVFINFDFLYHNCVLEFDLLPHILDLVSYIFLCTFIFIMRNFPDFSFLLLFLFTEEMSFHSQIEPDCFFDKRHLSSQRSAMSDRNFLRYHPANRSVTERDENITPCSYLMQPSAKILQA